MDIWQALWNQTRPAFRQQRTFDRAGRLALSQLVCLGRHTLTQLIATSGRHAVDWSADFRLFEEARVQPDALFRVARQAVETQLPPGAPFVALMDDTLFRKRGRHIAGTAWRRDPLGPPFQTNLVWGQRFLQLAAALPDRQGPSPARAIPIDFRHCPSPPKPRRNAPPEAWQTFRDRQKTDNLSARGVARLQTLRQALDEDSGGRERALIVAVDGSFTNRTVVQPLPPRTALIGRLRKDAKLYALPDGNPTAGRGRKKAYGVRLPTPEQIRQDDAFPWQTVRVFAAGRFHDVRIKTVAPLRWRPAGGERVLRLVVIAPLAYRPTQHARLLYRDPVYLICTDPSLPLNRLVQTALWRWEVEVNFRDEKTLLGTEQPQVRTPQAVETVPPFLVAAYSFLLLAAQQTTTLPHTLHVLQPKWARKHNAQRPSTAQLISLLREQLWGLGMERRNFSGFVNGSSPTAKPLKIENALASAVFYASQ